MKKHAKQPQEANFWSGFALGSLTVTALAYFITTKKGRETLQKVLEYAETVEDMPEELSEVLPLLQELLQRKDATPEPESKLVEEPPQSSTFEKIMEKVRNNTNIAKKKHVKKFFVKGGKILD